MIIRPFTAAEAETIASLHAASWRAAYRGIMADRFLDGDLIRNRVEEWRAKLRTANVGDWGLFLAEDAGEPLGFACVIPTRNSTWGAFLDNLHLRPDVRGRGLGRMLMARAAAWTVARGDRGLHLLVYEPNVRARSFYRRQGGVEVERIELTSPDGQVIPEIRVAWEDAQLLRGG